MRRLHVALFLVTFSCSGCLDLPAQWAKPNEDRLAALNGLCRSYGYVPGSSQFERCVKTEDQDQSTRAQAEQNGTIELGRADGTTYSKKIDQAVPPLVGIECKTMQDGQYSCVRK